jgi:hypothetical protein
MTGERINDEPKQFGWTFYFDSLSVAAIRNGMLENDDSQEFIWDIIDEVIENTDKIIYTNYMQNQIIPYALNETRNTILKILDVRSFFFFLVFSVWNYIWNVCAVDAKAEISLLGLIIGFRRDHCDLIEISAVLIF